MPEATPESRDDEWVLWDVVEEHLNELEFCIEQFESMLDHPLLTLDDLARGPEPRLWAHLDGLVIGGAPVVERLLGPAMAELDPGEPARVMAVVLALAAQKEFELVRPALSHGEPAVRVAAIRACCLLGGSDLHGWACSRLRATTSMRERAGLIDLAEGDGLEASTIEESLRSEDPLLVAAAARAARRGDRGNYLAILESLLESSDPGVREAAMVTALSMGSPSAWAKCERLAADSESPNPLAMVLSAALGTAVHHSRLADHLRRATHAAPALFALGFSGNATYVPLLLERLRGSHPIEAKIAAQAMATITGIDLGSDMFSVVPSRTPEEEDDEARRALPSVEEDREDLLPLPEEALSELNADAIERHWETIAPRFDASTRYWGGVPFGPTAALDYLESAPLRRRHALALSLAIRSGGRVWLDTRTSTAVQRQQSMGARAIEGRTLLRHFTGW